MATANFYVTTGKGVLKINSGQTLDLPEDRAKTLLDGGKIKAISIKWDTLSHIHLQTARQLAEEGQNLRLHTPEISKIEDSLNEIWLACLHGRAALDDFRAINEKWANTIRVANERSKRGRLF